jgi:hypothetical protein
MAAAILTVGGEGLDVLVMSQQPKFLELVRKAIR